MNGGTCIDGVDNFTCSCPPRLTGVFCECLIVDSFTLDCTYTSPSPITLPTSPLPTTETPTTLTEKQTTLETTIFESTEVPNATTFYSSETTTASVTYPSTSVETTSGISEITVSGITTETTQEVSTTREAKENATTQIYITIPPEVPQTTMVATTTVSTTTMATTTQEEVYTTTEVTTQHTPTISAITEFSVRTVETKKTTIGPTTTKLVPTIPLTIPPNVTFTTAVSSEITFQYITEGTTLISSIEPFLTDVPTTTTSEELMSPTFTSPEVNATKTIPDCGDSETKCQNGGTCVYTTEGYRV